jgi:hypothetical protein
MHKLSAASFLKGYEQAATTHQVLLDVANAERLARFIPINGMRFSRRDVSEKIEQLSLLVDELNNLGLRGSALSIERGLEVLRSPAPIVDGEGEDIVEFNSAELARLQTALSQGTSRIADDFRSQILLALDPRKILYYEEPKPFGEVVFSNFPSANEDISEGATCLSLDRGTACVMHLNRACEVGLAALSKAVNVVNQNNWGSYIKEINNELDSRAKKSGARTADEQFYAETALQFDYVRRAWRNPTMHVEKSYSVERAEEIFLAVKSFMRLLATRLKE